MIGNRANPTNVRCVIEEFAEAGIVLVSISYRLHRETYVFVTIENRNREWFCGY